MKISFKIVNSMMLNSSIDTPSTVASYNDMGRKKNSLWTSNCKKICFINYVKNEKSEMTVLK